jgi:hypothetical protein
MDMLSAGAKNALRGVNADVIELPARTHGTIDE